MKRWLCAALLVEALAACADAPTEEPQNDGGFSPGTGSGGLDPDDSCGKIEHEAVPRPVNLYIMFDKSSSMVGDKWDAAEAGLGAFVDAPESEGMRVALRFLPREPDAVAACDAKGYQEPTVAYATLPDNAAAIKAAVAAEEPDGLSTPIWPALGGAILNGLALGESAPDERAAVLLVTDGEANGPAASCSGVDPEDPMEIAALAAAGAALDPPVRTFVVGLPGVDQDLAAAIAEAGDTDEPVLVGANDVEGEFEQALAKVRGDAVPCEYELPQEVIDGDVQIGQVNIHVVPSDGDDYLVPFDPACDGEGWHWDDPAMPATIVLCDASCDQVKIGFSGAVRVLLGCATVIE